MHATKTRGVAIFLHKSFPFETQHTYKDSESAFIIIKGLVAGRKLRIPNVYAPNDAQTSFFSNFFDTL